MPRYWLMKSEPEAFSIDDLARAKNGTTRWDGVRNYQARNFLRDDISLGDGVLFYHSSVDPPGPMFPDGAGVSNFGSVPASRSP